MALRLLTRWAFLAFTTPSFKVLKALVYMGAIVHTISSSYLELEIELYIQQKFKCDYLALSCVSFFMDANFRKFHVNLSICTFLKLYVMLLLVMQILKPCNYKHNLEFLICKENNCKKALHNKPNVCRVNNWLSSCP